MIHVELSKSMAAILKMPQHVEYQKKVFAYDLFTLSITLLTDTAQKCHFHVLNCPTNALHSEQNFEGWIW